MDGADIIIGYVAEDAVFISSAATGTAVGPAAAGGIASF
jgi:hypothetical protein